MQIRCCKFVQTRRVFAQTRTQSETDQDVHESDDAVHVSKIQSHKWTTRNGLVSHRERLQARKSHFIIVFKRERRSITSFFFWILLNNRFIWVRWVCFRIFPLKQNQAHQVRPLHRPVAIRPYVFPNVLTSRPIVVT